MLQHNEDKTTPGLETRRNRLPREHRHDLLEAKDRTIAELKEQVALLRSDLKRKDAILARIAEDIGELLPPAGVSEAAVGGVPDASRTPEARLRQERPTLPNGYRVVAIASNAWVLVAPRGLRVASYRGELDLRRVASDARKHHERE